MPTATEQEVEKKQKEAAKQFYTQLQDLVSKGHPDVKKDVDSLTSKFKAMEDDGINFKTLKEDVEKMMAGYEKIKDQLRRNSGLRIPGLEDEREAKKFSILRAAICVKNGAHKNGNWNIRDGVEAGFEKEVWAESKKLVEKAGHVVGIDADGGYFVPDQIIPDIIGAIYTQSVFIGLEGSGQTRISVLDGLTGQPAKIPKFNGGMLAYWVGEQTTYPESYTKVANVTLAPKKLGILTRITDEMRRFQGYGFENLMRVDMQRAGAKLIDFAVPYGKGTQDEPKGFALYGGSTEPADSKIKTYCAENNTSAFPATLAGGELTFDGLQNFMGLFEDDNVTPDGSFAIISAPRYFRRLKQLKVQFYSGQTTNQAYLLGVPMLTDARLKDIVGVDFAKSTQLPTANFAGKTLGLTATTPSDLSYGDVFMGNWSEVLFGRWSGIEIVDDGGTGVGFGSDQTYIKFRMYCDIGVRQNRAIGICPDAKMR